MFLHIMLFLLSLTAFIFCNYVAFLIYKMKGPPGLIILDIVLGFANLPFVITWASKIIGEMQ